MRSRLDQERRTLARRPRRTTPARAFSQSIAIRAERKTMAVIPINMARVSQNLRAFNLLETLRRNCRPVSLRRRL